MNLAPRVDAPPSLPPARRAGRGFTLIEMLVVLMIMGLLVGLVGASARPDDKAQLRVEVERLAQLMDLAATDSRLSGRPLAWTANETGYRFWRFGEDLGWSEIVNDDFLRARTLPQGMTMANLRVENLRPSESMRVEFDSYGATHVFSVDMSFGAAHFTLASSPVGDMRVLARGG